MEASNSTNTANQTQTGATTTGHTGVGHTGLGHTGTGVTQVSFSAPAPDVGGQADGPSIGDVKGAKLELILLATIVSVVLVIVAMSGAFSVWTTQQQFSDTAQTFTSRFQDQARELGETVSHTLSLTSAASLRDSNYAFLTEIAKEIIDDNPNVLRVRIIDAEGLLVADSDPAGELGKQEGAVGERRSSTGSYKGQPVFEYHEPIQYGASVGPGTVVLTYSLAKLQGQLRELEVSKKESIRAVTVRTVLFGVGFLVVGALIAAVQSRRITRPLRALTDGALRLARGELKARVADSGGAGREVRALGVVFNHMADRIMWLLEDVRSKAALERDVQLARTVQETLLPARATFRVGSVRITGACQTADACGGDWWLRASLDDRRMVFGIGDVTGHGLATALVASSATSGLAAAMRMREPESITANMLISSLNQTLFQVGRGEYQMSSTLAVIDAATGEMEFASGAHPSACHLRRSTNEVSSLLARGALLGASEKSTYSSRKTSLQPGDVVVWYTDGLTECSDAAGKPYGFQRLCQVVQQNASQPVEGILEAVLTDVRAHGKGAQQEDDITVVIAEYQPV